MFLTAIIIGLSFFNLAGQAGKLFKGTLISLIGQTFFITPLIFVLGGLIFFNLKQNAKLLVAFGVLMLTLGVTGILGGFAIRQGEINPAINGGWVGRTIAGPLFLAFDFWVTEIIFFAVIIIGLIVLRQFSPKDREEKFPDKKKEEEIKPSLIKNVFTPKFKIKEVPSFDKLPEPKDLIPPAERQFSALEPKIKTGELLLATGKKPETSYQFPPLDLLEPDRGAPAAGDIKINSAIIKRTLQNFEIPVEMSEVNIGPTVTQYTFKPAEGVKLSKITALGNDLALALAAHPIRIEAPIPGRSLVGIEIPNRIRVSVRLRNLVENPNFQNSISNLSFVLGRDVSGSPAYADLAKMPHLLVAGSTGTGKTICLNSIMTSLLYRNSPATLRFILIDPKRVEFPVYNDMPHLLTPVIFDAQKSVNTLKWLVGEMERRFEVLSGERARDIITYNETMIKKEMESMPYIVLVIDELADLMAARGREIEAGIVRLAQMARAVGIHLILATQRPSVEVITGLIKANITSRITFQVASQVDSRTVLDSAGAEKLLGLGDMLFISAEITKPRRIQGAYVSDKEVRRVVKFIKSKGEIVKVGTEEFQKEDAGSEEVKSGEKPKPVFLSGDKLAESVEKTLEESGEFDFFNGGEDPLYEEAKRVVAEAKKASSSLLQRRLRIGYARAARLIDFLEEKGVVGPGEGAKPREVYVNDQGQNPEDWKKI